MNEVREQADEIYERADARLLWQMPDEVYEAAAVLIASQKHDHPLSPTDIAAAMNVDKDDIHHAKRRICRELDINTMPRSAHNYVDKICTDMNLPDAVADLATQIVNESTEATVGRAPSSIAAAAIYSAGVDADLDITQSDISDVANVSEVTIRSMYRDMLAEADRKVEA